jgi:hypothetical protein
VNLTETTALLALVSQIMPAQRIDEFTPDAWTLVLADVTFADAQAAVVAVAKRAPFVAPAEIIAEVKKIRRDRAEHAGPEAIPDADPDDPVAYQRALREGRWRAAEGLKPRPMLTVGGQQVPAVVAVAAKALPRVPSGPPERGA